MSPVLALEPDAVEQTWPRALRTNGDRGGAPIIVVAHNRLLRDATVSALMGAEDLEIALVVEAAEELVRALARGCQGEVVLMDCAHALATTIDQVRELAAIRPPLKIIIIDAPQTTSDLLDLLAAGAAALLLKRATVDDIVCTTRVVLGGATVLPPPLIDALRATVATRAATDVSARQATEWQVTRREHEIMALIADGLSNKEIANALNIATFTVKSHVHNVLQKLGLRTRAQIARSVLLARQQPPARTAGGSAA